ncbi:MAG: AraC family transcriptional regulator [Desulfobacterales bacterium]|nr:AraC family transcriptional regulator [Desulfobacterales bacterium]
MRESARPGPDPRALESVLRAVDFVEERMGDPVGVEDMARAAFYSPSTFPGSSPRPSATRPTTTSCAAGWPPPRRRWSAGTGASRPWLLDYGFEAPDSFSRAFRRCFGMLPSEARKAGTYPRRIARTRIDPGYAADMLESPPGPPERVETGDLGAVRRGPRPRAGPGGLRDRSGAARIWRLQAYSRGARRDRAAIAVEAAGDAGKAGTVPEIPAYPGLSTLVPAGTFARFRLPRGAAGLRTAVEFAYRAWLPGAGDLGRARLRPCGVR